MVVIDMSAAFAADGLVNSHPIRIPITRPEEISQIFDSITYEKVFKYIIHVFDFALMLSSYV